jgi:hypothetical protein
MKPEILQAILITSIGLALNALWTIHNLHVRSEMRKMVDDLKEYMRAQFVETPLCKAQMGGVERRLAEIGA